MSQGTGVSAVFMDRDGTICVLVEYLQDPDGMELLPGAGAAIALMNGLGLRTVVVTNQSALERGYFTQEVLEAVHERMTRLIEDQGARLDAIYYCPHHPDKGCSCRKPEPGLLVKASQELNVDLSRSYMVGDRMGDIECGRAAGCRTVLVLTGYGSGELALRDKWKVIPDHICDNILGAAEWIGKDMKR